MLSKCLILCRPSEFNIIENEIIAIEIAISMINFFTLFIFVPIICMFTACLFDLKCSKYKFIKHCSFPVKNESWSCFSPD